MAYMHIDNLYKAQEILAFKECYAMEKIHGTSAHLRWDGQTVSYFAGGVSHEMFLKLFDHDALVLAFLQHIEGPCYVYGEAYGGKCQGMSKTYGLDLRFVAFDVKIGDCWLAVPMAHDVVQSLSLDFVHYVNIPTDLVAIDAERDAPSVQAVKNGITEPKLREGIVLRPPFEATLNNGKRVICKHKREEFRERQSIPEIDPTKRQVLEGAEAVAFEWVTPMRLAHVLDKLVGEKDISLTGEVIKAMIADVLREASGEIVEAKSAQKAIGSRAAKLYKGWLANQIESVT